MNLEPRVLSACRLLIAAFLLLPLCGAPPLLAADTVEQQQKTIYTCPMHRDVKSHQGGKCPKCGMALRGVSPKVEDARSAETPPGGLDNLKMPDTEVYDQDGRKLHFYSDLVQGKTVAINFLFTTCTTICPPLAATFRKVQKDLGARVGQDIALISVSVDPAVDTPDRLKSFASKFSAEPGWTFVTGSPREIDKLLLALGAYVPNKNDHTPMIVVGNDAARYWTRAYGLAPAPKLVAIIAEVAKRKPSGPSE